MKSSSQPTTNVTIVILVASLLVRLLIAPLGAHPGDLSIFTYWTAVLAKHGWLAAYTIPDTNYPPLGMLLLWLPHQTLELLRLSAPTGSPLWLICFKLPMILADLLVIALVSRLSSWRWLPISLALNPALILMSAWWGQLDSVYVALLVAAVFVALHRRPFWAGISFGLALMVKPQPVFFTPIVVCALLSRLSLSDSDNSYRAQISQLVLFGAGLALAILIPMLPFVATGQTAVVLQHVQNPVIGPNFPTLNALNFWYVVTGGAGNWHFNAPLLLPDTTLLIGGLSYRVVGIILVIGWLILVCALVWRARRSAPAWFLAGVLIALGIFLWPTQAHERYSLAAVAFAAAFVGISGRGEAREGMSDEIVLQKSAVLYAAITLSVTLNLLWAAPPIRLLEPFAGTLIPAMLIAMSLIACAVWGVLRLEMLGLQRNGGIKRSEIESS